MGEVYLGEHLRMGRQDAIKLLRAGVAHDPEAVARFTRGARNVAQIRHPHVCQVYDFGETDDGALFLAMEYVQGGSLGDLLRTHGPLPLAVAARFLAEAASALDAAHALGIVHRDLKPDNLMLTGGIPAGPGAEASWGHIKVVDFDIARGPAAEEGASVTRHGFVVGTPEYMSPEQLTGDPLDARSDVYALTLILVRMLTGRLPFPGTTAQEVMLQRLTEEPAPLETLAPEGITFPTPLAEAVRRGLARRAEERTPSAGTLAREVLDALRLAGLGEDPPAAPSADVSAEATRAISGAGAGADSGPGADSRASADPDPRSGGGSTTPSRGVAVAAGVVLFALLGAGGWWWMAGNAGESAAPGGSGAETALAPPSAEAPEGMEGTEGGTARADPEGREPGAAAAGDRPPAGAPEIAPDVASDLAPGAPTGPGTGSAGPPPSATTPSPGALPPPTGTPTEPSVAGATPLRLALPASEARALLVRQFGAQDDTDGPVSPAIHRAVRDTTFAVWNLPGLSTPDSALAAHVLGISLVALGQREEGLEWLDRAVQVEPLERYAAVRDALRRSPR